MIIYLNEQLKDLYGVTDKDYLDWCKKNNKPLSYKETVSEFVFKLRTGRLVKDNHGVLKVKKPRKSKV